MSTCDKNHVLITYEAEGLNGCMNKVNLGTEWVNNCDKQNLILFHITNFMAQ